MKFQFSISRNSQPLFYVNVVIQL